MKKIKLIPTFGFLSLLSFIITHWLFVQSHQTSDFSDYAGIVMKRINGELSIETSKGFDHSSKFRIASLSKSITGYVIRRLKKQGTLTPSMTIGTALLPKWTIENPKISQILVDDLITMRSGIEEVIEQKPWDFSNLSEEDFIERLNKASVDTNQQFKYSNTSYGILSLIIQSKTGLNPLEYIKSIFPLLKDEFDDSLSKSVLPGHLQVLGIDYPASWLYERLWKRGYDNPWDGSGNYIASASGLATLYQHILSDAEFIAQLKTLADQGLGYAYGFGLKKSSSQLYLQHQGALSPLGYSSFFVLQPEEKNFIIGLSNLDQSFQDSKLISKALFKLNIKNEYNDTIIISDLIHRFIYELAALILVFQILPIIILLAFLTRNARTHSIDYIRQIFTSHLFYFNPLMLAFLLLIIFALWKNSLKPRIIQLKESLSVHDLINLIISIFFFIYFWI